MTGAGLSRRLARIEAAAIDQGEPMYVICIDDGTGAPITATAAGRSVDCRNLPVGYAPWWFHIIERPDGPQ